MKIFIYKTAIVSITFLILFEILIGNRINKFKSHIDLMTSKKNIAEIKIKFFEELKKGSEKDNYFTAEERLIINNFIDKVRSELKDKN